MIWMVVAAVEDSCAKKQTTKKTTLLWIFHEMLGVFHMVVNR